MGDSLPAIDMGEGVSAPLAVCLYDETNFSLEFAGIIFEICDSDVFWKTLQVMPPLFPMNFTFMLRLGSCSAPVPVAACQESWTLDVAYSNIRHSSIYDGNTIGTGYGRGKLDSPLGWVPWSFDQNQWMEIDIGQSLNVAGVVTQGRAEAGQQWVTSFTVQTSLDRTTWASVDSGKVFQGNYDRNTKVVNLFGSGVLATYVRIRPTGWNELIAMRAAVLVCKFNCSGSSSQALVNSQTSESCDSWLLCVWVQSFCIAL
jgi:hypothetical protein